MRLINAAIVLLPVAFWTHGAWAQPVVGDVRAGRATADQVCSRCHSVAKNQARSPDPKAPTFMQIANTPGMTTMALTAALTTPHAGMPMFVLTAGERASIIAYLLSLKD